MRPSYPRRTEGAARRLSANPLGGWRAGAWLASVIAAFLVCATANAQYEPPKQMTVSPLGVELTKLRFTYKAVDLSMGPFSLERSFLGGPAVTGSNMFGPHWTHNYSAYVVEGFPNELDKTYLVIGRSTVHFMRNYYGSYDCWNPDCYGTTLQLVGGAFVYTDREGNVYTFNASVNAFPPYQGRRNQRVARVDYANGHTLTYTYVSSRLRQISSNNGYALVFDNTASGYVQRACAYNRAVTYVTASSTCVGAALVVNYSYSAPSSTNLSSVVDVMGQTWGYDYEASHPNWLTCVRQVNSSSCLISNAYVSPGLVQTTADGGVWTYWYAGPDPEDPQQPGEPPAYSEGAYSGPGGLSVNAVFGAGLLNSYDVNGRSTSLTWNGIELESLTHQEGNRITYARDSRQNVVSETWTPKPGSSLSPISRTFTFPNGAGDCTSVVRRICNKPISTRDYNQTQPPLASDPLAQTDFTYDPAHGGVLTETGPAPTPGAPRPETRHMYEPRQAWVSNGSGYVATNPPIWVQTATSSCRTSAPTGNPSAPCAVADDEVRTTYDYGPDSGPNTLLLRGQAVTSTDNGVTATLRTCYSYDALGRRISETQPNANLASCP
jgi:YD repeat-containing protein